MALPVGGKTVKWPPEDFAGVLNIMEEAAAWYGGTPETLAAYYATCPTTLLYPAGTRFWRRVATNVRSVAIHVPIAADIAQASAHILFSEAVKVTCENDATQKRLLELLDLARFDAKCLEAADICSGIGSVYVKIDYDKAVADHPFLTIVQPDMAVPEFTWGKLTAVTFWRVVAVDDKKNEIYRHLERHERGGIENGLYKGTAEFLGDQIDLTSVAATKDLIPYTTHSDLNVVYVPNYLPNRMFRGWAIGQADTAGCISLMEALDEAETSWIRDVRLGASRIIVPESYLETNLAAEQQVTFNMDREIFSPLEYDPTVEGTKLTVFQPTIRVDEHYKTVTELLFRIMSVAGFAPQTFGLGSDNLTSSASGVALKVRERKTLLTKSRKERYWGPELEYLLLRLQIVDRDVFDSGIEPMPVTVAFGDSYAPDLIELSTVTELLKRGESASIEERVKLLHQEWDDAAVQAEVDRILADKAAGLDTALPSFGNSTPAAGQGSPQQGLRND